MSDKVGRKTGKFDIKTKSLTEKAKANML